MLQAPGGDHAAAAVGARGRRLHRAPVRREAPADARRTQCRRARHAGVHPAPVRPRAAQRRRAARRRLHARHARRRPAARSCATRQGNPTGLLLAKPNAAILYATLAKGPKLPLGVPAQLDAPLHARAQPPRRHQRDRRRRRLPELSRGLRSHPAAGRCRPAHRAHRLQPVHAEAQGRRRTTSCSWTAQLQATSRATTTSATTAPARCWCSRPPTSRTSASRGPSWRRRWKASSRRWCASSRRTAGPGACTRPTTRPSAARSMCSSG